MQSTTSNGPPDFLIKTTLGCSLVVILIVVPFTINNYFQDRYLLGVATLSVTVVCAINVWYGYCGRYSSAINSYLMAPAATATIIFSFIKLGIVASYWSYLLALSFYFVLPEQRAWLANVLFVFVVIPIAWYLLDHSAAIRFTAVLLGTSLFAFISLREINTLHDLLKQQAVTDTLTGLYNRSLLQVTLEQAISQSRRTEMPMTLIMMDIDHFKKVNDELGHDMGDSVLRSMGAYLAERPRSSDTVFRTGGEEFLILAYNTDEESAMILAEELRGEIEELSMIPNGEVTASLGVAGLQKNMDVDEWMKACDEKLYRAKAGGRNRVVG